MKRHAGRGLDTKAAEPSLTRTGHHRQSIKPLYARPGGKREPSGGAPFSGDVYTTFTAGEAQNEKMEENEAAIKPSNQMKGEQKDAHYHSRPPTCRANPGRNTRTRTRTRSELADPHSKT